MHAKHPGRLPYRLIIGVLIATLIGAGCGGGIAVPEASNPVDIEIPEPTIDWERTIDRLTYVGAGSAPTRSEVELVAAVIDDVPTALVNQVDVRWVVRATSQTEVRSDHPNAVAFAVGPDIYLLDRAFTLSDGGSTRFDLGRAVAHELVHVAQYQTLDPAYLEAVSSGEVAQLNPIDGSLLVRDFVRATGWTNESSDELRPRWNLAGPASTPYGATNPGEDMAEAVAMVVMGLGELIPEPQRAWVLDWLDSTADALALGQPWAPEGAAEVLSEVALYDTAAVAELQGARERAEPLYFTLPETLGDTDDIVDLIESRLGARVMPGSLSAIPDERAPRYGGRFSGPDGRLWWVELWDFRFAAQGASSTNVPILVYVAIW